MLDTKLKNMRRLKNGIIALCVLIPTIILVALYPKMEQAVLQYWGEEKEESEGDLSDQWKLQNNCINYLVEASYYIYGQMYQELTDTEVDFSVLDTYGWINDYYRVNEQTDYYAELNLVQKASEDTEALEHTSSSTETAVQTNTAVKTNTERELVPFIDYETAAVPPSYEEGGMKGYISLRYDAYGNLADIRYVFIDEVDISGINFYERAKESIDHYVNNVNFYVDERFGNAETGSNEKYGEVYHTEPSLGSQKLQIKENYLNLRPKNFQVVFALYDSDFIYKTNEVFYYWSMEDIYIEIGAVWIILILAFAVALAAMLLPFVKPLQTGREKLFSISFEAAAALIAAGIAGAAGMFVLMSHTNRYILDKLAAEHPVNILGTKLSGSDMYWILLVLNFLGWAVLFFAEYVTAASLRQFFIGPKEYVKNRFLIAKVFRWIKKQFYRLYGYVTDLDLNDRLIQSIIKVVGVNFLVLTVLCCLWLFGIMGILIYSILLFVLMRKYGEKLQLQYRSILQATQQMADGNLKIQLEEDLGMFHPIGESLEKVQQGFAKAVAEEAKSQSMKTELITNVSHDLKTPLTAIITYVDLLKKEGLTEEERDSYIGTIDQKSQRLKVLIEDLFEVSKANSGNIQMHFMDVDVVNLMKQVRLEMEEKIADSNLNFRWNLPDKRILLSLDGSRTYRIFENLLNNILKYSMPRTRVYIDILEQGEEVHILFRNISAVELEGDVYQLTDRFVRGDTSRNTEGSGLGLAIVKSFVELQNGKLQIEVDGDLFKVLIIWKK